MGQMNIPIERHPLEPFLPKGAKVLMLGSFPPARKRWSMEFFYPNWINDMWRLMGFIFYSDKDHFVAEDENGKKLKKFDKEKCESHAREKGIAMFDTATEIRRLKDNASDKFLEVVTPTDLPKLLKQIPDCQAIITTGQKAADIITGTFNCEDPAVGQYSEFFIDGRRIRLWRMPSSSRAYPLPLDKKAGFYQKMFREEGILP